MKNKATITTAGTLALAAVLYFAGISPQDIPRILGSGEGRLSAPSASADADRMIAEAFHERRSDIIVEGSGIVVKVLPDDTHGSPHQRFIIELISGQSVLVSHNIDLAPRVDDLRRGRQIEFRGEYEWNQRGGVIHWTHRDPQGRRRDGWLRYAGRTYK